ncbi:hypothetical protein FRC03_001248 [Tulasnella sp. 419]|nr:hypothetical protein FRC03_001248 [Tulasnella sp. 419]
MASLPPRENAARQSLPRMYNRFAKRDPQLYPLAAIMVTTLGVAGYFLTVRKPAQVPEPGKNFTSVSQKPFPPNVRSDPRWKDHGRLSGDHEITGGARIRRSETELPDGSKGTVSTR